MANKRAKTPAHDGLDLPGVFAALNDDALQDFADATPALGSLASASKQLSSLFRFRTWLEFEIDNPDDAARLLVSQARGRPFLKCGRLTASAADSAVWSMVGGLLRAAWQWQELSELQLDAGGMDLPPTVYGGDHVNTGVAGVLPALQALRHLTVKVPAFGACSAACIRRVTQLTQLKQLLLDVTQEPAADAAALDWTALAGLVQLQRLEMTHAPTVQPAAGPEGPFSLPSSLVTFSINAKCPDDYDAGDEREAVTGPWVTHLRGCPHLQQLQLWYGAQEYASTDHSAVLQLLAQHSKQLRELHMGVPRDSVPPADVYEDWSPTPALAALTGLQHLSAEGLCISNQADWQHMAQLTALTRLECVKLSCAPAQQAGITLPRLQILDVRTAPLSGTCLGLALLAFPALEQAYLSVPAPHHPGAMQPPGTPLVPHPTLQLIKVIMEDEGPGEAAAGAAAAAALVDKGAAAASFAALKPVLSGVSHLRIYGWPCSSTLPDLSGLTATSFEFGIESPDARGASHLQVVDIVSLVSPLVTLQSLDLSGVPWPCAQAVLPLQHMLPQLQHVCIWALHGSAHVAGAQKRHERQVLRQVKQLLRPGLQLWCRVQETAVAGVG